MTGFLQFIATRIGIYRTLASHLVNVVVDHFCIIRILTGCYDNSIHLWKIDGTHKKTIPGHCGPVKAVKWIEVSEESAGFVRFVIKYESHYLELLT